jgi:hypothetical protein
MQAAESPSLQMPRRRRRSRRSRVLRNFSKSWQRTRLRKAVLPLILAVGAVIGGYKVSVYVANQSMPSPAELNTVPDN